VQKEDQSMTNVHMIVGTLTLLLFIVNAGMYAVNMFRGKTVSYHRLVSIGAATLLLLQYALGFMLLGDDRDITVWHIVAALAAIVPVGIEHMFASGETGVRRRGMLGLFATIVTVILVLAAYGIGEANS
jgi:hypothetical protein